MVDLIRKSLLVGVGALALTRDRVDQFIGESVARGELSTEQGKSLVEELTHRAEQERQRVETLIQHQVNRAIEAAGYLPRTRVADLQARIDALESRVRELSIAKAVDSAATSPTSTPAAPVSEPPPAEVSPEDVEG